MVPSRSRAIRRLVVCVVCEESVEIQSRGNPQTCAGGLRHKLDKGAATKLEEVRSTFQMTLPGVHGFSSQIPPTVQFTVRLAEKSEGYVRVK